LPGLIRRPYFVFNYLTIKNKKNGKNKHLPELPEQTEEAFNFYKSVFKTDFGGEGIQRFGNIPDNPEMPLPPNRKNWYCMLNYLLWADMYQWAQIRITGNTHLTQTEK
jgi:hypothetical protein